MAEPVVMSIMEFSGNPDEVLGKMKGVEELASRKASEYGGISSTVVKTDDGVMIINFWDSEDGRHRMGDDPEIRQAIQDRVSRAYGTLCSATMMTSEETMDLLQRFYDKTDAGRAGRHSTPLE